MGGYILWIERGSFGFSKLGAFQQVFDNFDELWEALSPREQRDVMRFLIEKVVYDAEQESMSLQFHPSAYQAL